MIRTLRSPTPAAARRRRRLALAALAATIAPLAVGSHAVRAATPQTGGVVLDSFGGLHAFGGATLDTTGAPYWSGWDIARAVAVRDDGTGGWTLDGWGGIHAWGSAAAVTSPAYEQGTDIARDVVVVSRGSDGDLDGRQGYVLDGYGGIHAWGGAPDLTGPPSTSDVARSLVVHSAGDGTPDGGWVLDADGTVHAFGGAAGVAAPFTTGNRPEWVKARVVPGRGAYLVGHWGRVRTSGSVSPYWSGYSDWQGSDIQRDLHLFAVDNPTAQAQPMSAAAAALADAAMGAHGGVTLDAWGGLHPFGEIAVDTVGAPYWRGWDIARSVQVRADGSGGWTLDGWGGIHAWGSAPPVDTPSYWDGFDIARAIAVTSSTAGIADGHQGYLLDGWGGIHRWGGAPEIGGPPYLPGFDVYRGLAVHLSSEGVPDGGWAMDAAGRTYAFGAVPTLGDASPLAGRPLFRALHAGATGVWAVARFGKVYDVGTGVVEPDWQGWTDFGGWDIVRDIDLVDPVDPATPVQPLSDGAALAWSAAAAGRYLLSAPLYRQIYPLDCEAGTMQIVLAARGTAISQDAELAYWGADLRPAVKDSAGNILQWGDPYVSFVGNVHASEWNATGYGIYYPPLVRLAEALGHGAIGREGWSVSQLLDLVAEGYPAAVEGTYNMEYATPRTWTAWDGRSVQYVLNNHVFAVVGVDFGTGQVIINDPATGTQKAFSFADFTRSFSYIDNMATVVA